MDIITTGRKGKYLNTLERYHIYEINKENLHMNDTHIDTHTLLYLKHCTRFTQNNSTPSPPPHYSINTEDSTPHIHNIHTQANNIICKGSEQYTDRKSKYKKKQYNITL
jgi:hypothetical protein